MKDMVTLVALIVIVVCIAIACNRYMETMRYSHPVKVYPAEEYAPDTPTIEEQVNYYNSGGWGYYPNSASYQPQGNTYPVVKGN